MAGTDMYCDHGVFETDAVRCPLCPVTVGASPVLTTGQPARTELLRVQRGHPAVEPVATV